MRCSGSGVRMPATTSSPCALTRNSPKSARSPVDGLRVKQTPGARGVALVPEHHLDDVDRGAEVVRDLVGAAIDLRARRLPRVEDGTGRPAELLRRILGKRLSHLALVGLLVGGDQPTQVVGGQVDVLADAPSLLQRLELALEQVAVDPVDDLAVHLDQPAVRVAVRSRGLPVAAASPSTATSFRPRLRIVSIIPGIETAAPERTETSSGSEGSPKRLPGTVLERADVLVDLPPELVRHLARCHRRPAGVGRDREPRRDGNAERGHLREADALPAEELASPRSLLVERVDQAHGADPMCSATSHAGDRREAGHDHLVGERQRKVNPRPTARARSSTCRTSSSTRSTTRRAGASCRPRSSGARWSRSSRGTAG